MTARLTPRELPEGGGFSVPHVECVRAARLFLTQLEAAEERIAPETEHHRARYGEFAEVVARQSLNTQPLSCAVQIFAAMAAESALNLYGVLALGEKKFRKSFERLHAHEKVELVLSWARERPIAPDDEVRTICSRLARARNDFVHPKPKELKTRSSAHPSRTPAR
jgi:hypothetical protein